MASEIRYLNAKDYAKEKAKTLKFLQKTYAWYKNIEEGMENWENRNKLL